MAVGDRPFLQIVGAESPYEATRMVLDSIRRMDEDAQARVLRLAQELRKEIVARMTTAQNYEAHRLPRLMMDLNRTMDDWRQSYLVEQSSLLRDYALLGELQTGAPLAAAGIEISLPQTSISMLNASQRFSADMIHEITEDVLRQINREVIFAANGVQSPFETFKNIEGLIDDPLTFKSIASRSLTIARTEGGRLQSIAAQDRLERAADVVVGLEKQWRWSGISRPQHAAINNQIRKVDEQFNIPAGRRCPADKLMFPRDPAGLACQTINCKCQSLPYKQDWGLEKLAA